MDGVAISIIGRPRPLPGHDTPNPAHNTYTLKCEEPVIYNSSVTVLQFLIIILIWSLVVIATKILIDSSKAFKKLAACQPELIVRDGEVDIARCAKVGMTAEGLSRSLREQKIASMGDVVAAIMETNGSLTIRVRGDGSKRSLLPLVTDGQLVLSLIHI